jgi:hypothetical protein
MSQLAQSVSLAGSDKPGFYVTMAATYAAIAIVGFAPTYWVPLLRGTLDVAPILHLHALFFYGWIALFFVQTRLAAAGRIVRHREFGVAGVALATGMCFAGFAAAVHSVRLHSAQGFPEAARAFSVVPLTGIALFAVLVTLALLNVKHPAVHKRLLLVATASILQAAFGRWFALFLAPPVAAGQHAPPPPIAVTIMPGLLCDLLIVAAMIHDRRVNGRVHPVYWSAGAVLLAVQLLRFPIGPSPAWTATVNFLVTLAP